MKTYSVGHTDLVVSRIAYGCAGLSSWNRQPLGPETIRNAARLVQTARDNGITFFDQADVYGFGKSEEAMGKVLKQSPGLRNEIVIQSKCGQRFQGDPRPGDPFRVDCSREHILRSVEGSLRRLETDRLDLLLLHSPDPLLEPQEVAQAFDELQQAGKVRYFGVSNFSAAQLELLQKNLRQRLVVNQVQLGLAHADLIADSLQANRSPETRMTQNYTGALGTLDYCRLHGIQIQAHSPLRGYVKHSAVSQASNGDPKASGFITKLAREKKVTPSAMALAWLLRHPAQLLPLIGSTDPQHITENCAADRVSLSREEWFQLFAAGTGVSTARLLGIPEAFAAVLAAGQPEH